MVILKFDIFISYCKCISVSFIVYWSLLFLIISIVFALEKNPSVDQPHEGVDWPKCDGVPSDQLQTSLLRGV